MKKKHVLIVEDETIIAIDIKQCLESFEYIVDEVADNTEDAMFFVKKYSPDLVLMDIKLNGEEDGTAIVDEIQKKYKIPVVYLTSYTDEKTLKIAGSTNPYGYIVKPVDENQLNSAIKIALSRFYEENRVKQTNDRILKINSEYYYSLKERKLYYQGENISFTKKEEQFIYILAKHLGSTVSSEQIREEIWQNKDVAHSTLRSLVRRVRDKIDDDLIESFNGVGYKLKVR